MQSSLSAGWRLNEHKVFILRKKYAQQTLSLTLNSEQIMHDSVDHLFILKSMKGKIFLMIIHSKKIINQFFLLMGEAGIYPE